MMLSGGLGRRVAQAAVVLWLCVGAPAARAQEDEEPGDAGSPAGAAYLLDYDVRLVAAERAARVAIRIGPGGHVHQVRFAIDPQRHVGFQGDGKLEIEESAVTWEPPENGGTLRYGVRIDHLRDARSYDARAAADWMLFRGDDLVPPARVLTAPGAHSNATLHVRAPEGWHFVAPYAKAQDGSYPLDHPERRFDRPTGWMLAGRLGVSREKIAGVHVGVAGPAGQGVRRQDIVAFLRWNLPQLRKMVSPMPERLLVVGAGDPMWRGGLSGPRSLYLHAERPLIGPDWTSPLLHEVVHVAMGARSGRGGEWVSEGIAEYASIELMQRSKTISQKRYEKILARYAEMGASVADLSAPGVDAYRMRARAVTVLHELDETIRTASDGERSFDDVIRALSASREPLTTEALRRAAEREAKRDLRPFFRKVAPGKAEAAKPE